MRASTAFLFGIGTVGLALFGGLGGGLLVGNMMSPPPPKQAAEAGQIEPQTALQPMRPSNALPYMAATLAFTDPSIDGRAPPPRAMASAANDHAAKPADQAGAGQQIQDSQPGAAAMQASTPEDANAKAADTDLKHAAGRDRAERARRWAYRHRRGHADQQARDDQGGDGGSYYPYTSSDRRYRTAPYYADQAPRYGFPRMFGPDD